jgi:hypothetical protein
MCYRPMRLLHKTELKETILLYKLKTIVDSVVLTVRLWGPILCSLACLCKLVSVFVSASFEFQKSLHTEFYSTHKSFIILLRIIQC